LTRLRAVRAADLVGLWAFAGTAVSAARSGDSRDDDLEGTQVLDEDQAARTGKGLIRWSEVAVSDAERRAAVRRRLDCGALHTATDFWRAAFVFQHGDKPGDGLLAHTRSVVAPTRGARMLRGSLRRASTAICSLWAKIRSPGPLVAFLKAPDQVTEEPCGRALISDVLRAELQVPSQSRKEPQRAAFETQGSAP